MLSHLLYAAALLALGALMITTFIALAQAIATTPL